MVTHNLFYQIMIILTLNIPSWVKTIAVSGQQEDTATGSMMENMLQKLKGLLLNVFK